MRRDRLLRGMLRDRILVTLKTGESFEGLLDDWDERNLLLVASSAVDGERKAPLDGRGLWLQRDNIAYCQRLA